MDLFDLSRTILLLSHAPISKVRFARIVYFVHKELVRKKLMKIDAINYIRSPLGPVPEGLLNLALAGDIIAQKRQSAELSYANEEYTIDANPSETSLLEQYRDILSHIERTLKALRPYSTPDLVEMSHQDPSWQSHANGEVYTLTNADLKNTFPFSTLTPIRIKIRFSKPPKSGAMQANLLRGMISDIVKESTDLEYPDDASTSAAPKPPNTLRKIFRITFRPLKKSDSKAKPAKKTEQNPNKPPKTGRES